MGYEALGQLQDGREQVVALAQLYINGRERLKSMVAVPDQAGVDAIKQDQDKNQ